MALIQYNKGDFYGSIETSLETNKFLKSRNDIISKKYLLPTTTILLMLLIVLKIMIVQ
jgi:hypothetical protein